MTYAANMIRRVLDAGPFEGEDFYRLKVSGSESSPHVNVTLAQLAAIADVLDGRDHVERLYSAAARALERVQVSDDVSGAADEAATILSQVITLSGTPIEASPTEPTREQDAVAEEMAERYGSCAVSVPDVNGNVTIIGLTDDVVRVRVVVDRDGDELDTESSASRQHYIDTGRYLRRGEGMEA